MLAYRLPGWGMPPILTDVPVPTPAPGEFLIRVAGCGLCRSDLTMRAMPRTYGEKLGWQIPFTLGHETAGWIAAAPALVPAAIPARTSPSHPRAPSPSTVGDISDISSLSVTVDPVVRDLAVGDAVALVAAASCGTCPLCLRGLDNACPSGVTGRGFGRDGGLAEFVLAGSRRELIPLGPLDPRHAGPLTDAGATAYHAVRRALPHILPDGTAVVIGAGGLGAFAVQFLRVLTTAHVIAVDTNPARLDYATTLGAHSALPALTTTGADAVLDFVGTDETIAAGLGALRPGGAYALIGSSGGRLNRPWFGTLPRDAEIFTFQGGTIADAHEVIALAAAGRIRNEIEEFPHTAIDKAYTHLTTGTLTGRAVITFPASAPPGHP
ncbi:alcohol dehydrogenase catalytic domain-containing protein [Actinoplanes sp. NPDC051851]|uniref:alcohol dehydrogenase catalytic domain-containing protein n=1 Tax=Actinoplanes sp. NPDC051851 TaxID=3154753 RepID=UPI00341C7BFB